MVARSIRFAVLAILNGALWLALGGVGLTGPTYWSPRTPVDYAAVVLFSGATFTLGLCLLRLAIGRTRAAHGAAWVAGISAIVVSLANLGEDGLGIGPLGAVFVLGALVVLGALLVFGVALARSPESRALAVPIFLTVVGLVWLATGALASARMGPLALSVPRS